MDLISNTASSLTDHNSSTTTTTTTTATTTGQLSRYENQKRRDWNTFGQYLRNHRPPLTLARCSGAHVLEFLRYLDQFGKTKVHNPPCPFFGHPNPPAPCPCPLRQAWGSLDALVGRLRAAFEELGGGSPECNPFGARAVRLYLREVRDSQSKARGVSYDKKKKKKRQRASSLQSSTPPPQTPTPFHHHHIRHGEASGDQSGLSIEYSNLNSNNNNNNNGGGGGGGGGSSGDRSFR